MSDSFINFETIEFPGQVDPFEASFDPNAIFSRCGALLFVIDAQADYDEALKKMVPSIVRSYQINKNIKFEVFVHKVDGLSEETKMETHRKIFQTVQDDLADQGMEKIRITYHMTSIYDHSIFEAFSKVIQKLIKQLLALETLLDIFNQVRVSGGRTCLGVERGEVVPVRCGQQDLHRHGHVPRGHGHVRAVLRHDRCRDGHFLHLRVRRCSWFQSCRNSNRADGFDPNSSAVITLKTKQVIFLRQINMYLALVCVVKEENYEKQGLIDHNFDVFKGVSPNPRPNSPQHIEQVFKLGRLNGPAD